MDSLEKARYIRVKLAEYGLTRKWLGEQLQERDVSADASEISKALSGALTTPKASAIIYNSARILNDYEREHL